MFNHAEKATTAERKNLCVLTYIKYISLDQKIDGRQSISALVLLRGFVRLPSEHLFHEFLVITLCIR